MGDRNRYIEEIPLDDAFERMGGSWNGSEEDEEGLSVQTESLNLRADGTFSHSVSHQLSLSGPDAAQTSSECSGKWRLFNVRFLGADLDARGGDTEIHFEPASGRSTQLLTERLVVCGVNPRLNGFSGEACRLFDVARGVDDPQSLAPGVSRRSSREQKAAPAEDEVEERVATLEELQAEAPGIAEATGRTVDECLAALLEHNSTEEAVEYLLNSASSGSAAGPTPSSASGSRVELVDGPPEEDVRRAVEITGRTVAECRAALEAHRHPEDAIVWLLNLDNAAALAAGSSSRSSIPAEEPKSAQEASQSVSKSLRRIAEDDSVLGCMPAEEEQKQCEAKRQISKRKSATDREASESPIRESIAVSRSDGLTTADCSPDVSGDGDDSILIQEAEAPIEEHPPKRPRVAEVAE